MVKRILLIVLLIFISSTVFAQFYKQQPDYEFEVDFNKIFGSTFYYKGYYVEDITAFNNVLDSYIKYVSELKKDYYIVNSYSLKDNTVLDERIKRFMRWGNVTVCTTSYEDRYGNIEYLLNYSFDNYQTFGFLSLTTCHYTKMFYSVTTGHCQLKRVTETELKKRRSLDMESALKLLLDNSYDEFSANYVSFTNLSDVLISTFKQDKNSIQKNLIQIYRDKNIEFKWLTDSNGFVTEWIVFFKEDIFE